MCFFYSFLRTALYWIDYEKMPEHTSVTSRVCTKWIDDVDIYVMGKCADGSPPKYYAAYRGIQYSKQNPKVSTRLFRCGLLHLLAIDALTH